MKKTEGFSPKDLGSLVDRAIHKAAIRKMKTQTGNCRSVRVDRNVRSHSVKEIKCHSLHGCKFNLYACKILIECK